MSKNPYSERVGGTHIFEMDMGIRLGFTGIQ